MTPRTTLTVFAPVKGALVPLEQVPDPVFNQKMLGDGIAIDPADGTLVAPFDGKIINFNPNLHAFVLEKNGIELLVHVGINTVSLHGEGFTALVHVGDNVKAGQPILHFNLARVSAALQTPFVLCVVTSPSQAIVRPSMCEIVQAGQPLFTVSLGSTKQSAAHTNECVESAPLTITNVHGLHARPAGILARLCGTYAHTVFLCKQDQCVNAKSIVGIMSLALAQGDHVTLKVAGPQPQAKAFIAQLEAAFANGFGEQETQSTAQPANTFKGLCLVKGTAAGPAFLWKANEVAFEQYSLDPQADLLLLQTTLRTFVAQTQQNLQTMPEHTRAILETQLDFVQDPDLLQNAQEIILKGNSAAYGFYHAVENALNLLTQTDNPLLQERRADLQDIRRQILLKLNGQVAPRPSLPAHCVVVAEDLFPSDVAYLQGKVSAVVLAQGSATSHVGILLKNSGIVSLIQVGKSILQISPSTPLYVDATQGRVWQNPPEHLYHQASTATVVRTDKKPVVTLDGTALEISGNVSTIEEAKQAAAHGADGLGLVRTEILFASHTKAPSEEEQRVLYQQIADEFTKPVTIRLVDAGADKPLPFLKFPVETNPMLGVRGIRAFQENEAFFRSQLHALLQVHTQAPLRILLPMVTFAEEVTFWRHLLQEEQQRLHSIASIQLGVMIETPAAALRSNDLTQGVDYFSIGTNDLTQYTLAIDRAHTLLAEQQDVLDPAVLRLISLTCQAAQQATIPVSVCGAAAADLEAACVLLGLGVRELAVPTAQIATIKENLRQVRLQACIKLAKQALECKNAKQVRALFSSNRGII